MIRYIYKITNNINGKIYIGQHSTIDDNEKFESYMGSGKLLKMAFAKYGIENFSKEIVAYVNGTKEELDYAEIFFIKHYRNKIGAENMYNIASGGNGGFENVNPSHPGERNGMYGRKHSEESRRRMSEAHKRENLSEETRRKMSESSKKENLSEETIRRMSEAQNNKPKISEETRRKISEASKGNKASLGRHHYNNGVIEVCKFSCPEGFVPGRLCSDSEETRARKSAAAKSRVGWNHSEDTKNKIRSKKVGLKWFNNGIIQVQAKEQPEGFKRGMLKFNKNKNK